MRMYDVILKKRQGQKLSKEEILFFLQGYVSGEIPDYQVSALMMAIYFQGMDEAETFTLVEGMVNSGDQIDLSELPGIKVDKHSTGGVGDKTSLVLGPMVAAAGIPVAKMSGRGLGHTGGTLDKMESYTGLSVEISRSDFLQQVKEIGIAIAGQTGNLVPADKKLYALRDVTATVENYSLIAGSIMSKKLASGAGAIVLDVKCGDGAFMKDLTSARKLARTMVDIGNHFGRETVAFITAMEQPLGKAIGNSVEITEAIQTLRGKGPEDLTELCLTLGSQMLIAGGKAQTNEQARNILQELIDSGKALQKFKELILAQGGDPAQVEDESLLPLGEAQLDVPAPESGFVTRLEAEEVGIASMLLGAGRETKSSIIDHSAGIILHAKVGDQVQKGQSLARLYSSNSETLEAAAQKFKESLTIGPAPIVQPALILDKII